MTVASFRAKEVSYILISQETATIIKSCSATSNNQKIMTGQEMDEPVSVLKLSGFLARYSDLWTQRCAKGLVQLKVVLYRHGDQ